MAAVISSLSRVLDNENMSTRIRKGAPGRASTRTSYPGDDDISSDGGPCEIALSSPAARWFSSTPGFTPPPAAAGPHLADPASTLERPSTEPFGHWGLTRRGPSRSRGPAIRANSAHPAQVSFRRRRSWQTRRQVASREPRTARSSSARGRLVRRLANHHEVFWPIDLAIPDIATVRWRALGIFDPESCSGFSRAR